MRGSAMLRDISFQSNAYLKYGLFFLYIGRFQYRLTVFHFEYPEKIMSLPLLNQWFSVKIYQNKLSASIIIKNRWKTNVIRISVLPMSLEYYNRIIIQIKIANCKNCVFSIIYKRIKLVWLSIKSVLIEPKTKKHKQL